MTTRLGYTVSGGAYLPAANAVGLVVTVTSGSAAAYAGLPGEPSHHLLGSISAGQSFAVPALAAGEVLSVQSGGSFSYTLSTAPAAPPTPPEVPSLAESAELATWSCTSTPCPWGSSASNYAANWPSEDSPSNSRLGYTTNKGVYLPASAANGLIITLEAGTASAYAGAPGASSHRLLGTIHSGDSLEIEGLAADETLSLQSSNAFTYLLEVGEPEGEPPPQAGDGVSSLVTWSCVSSPCPWGGSTDGQAIVWPASAAPVNTRLGYVVSEGIYLPAAAANGMTIVVEAGSADVYVGTPNAASHQFLGTVSPEAPFEVSGLTTGQVLSVQSYATFSYVVEGGGAGADPEPEPEPDPDPDPSGEPEYNSVSARWLCNTPGCTYADWRSAVVNWPSWAAYSTNARSGYNARRVVTEDGSTTLYPYMGSWADGCHVTANAGIVLIIEWERGTDEWRETYLEPGESHTINLSGSEDGAMIESYEGSPGFNATVTNCTPQAI